MNKEEEKEESIVNLLNLPIEIIIKIFNFLTIKSLLNLSSTCKILLEILNENELYWKEIFQLILKDNLLLNNNQPIFINNKIISFKDQAKFAIINSKSLGFFVASTGR